jgi:hypothetical protein
MPKRSAAAPNKASYVLPFALYIHGLTLAACVGRPRIKRQHRQQKNLHKQQTILAANNEMLKFY